MEASRKYVTLGQRLAQYGLADQEKHLTDLQVHSGRHMTLSTEAAGNIHELHPRSLDELRQWAGIPVGAVVDERTASLASRFPALQRMSQELPRYLTPAQERAAAAYLVGESPALSARTSKRVEAALSEMGSIISVIVFRDIYVDNDTTLTVAADIDTLFARYIYLGEDNGNLIMRAPGGVINCAGLTSFPGL
jgi:hypothetical protein